MQANVPTLHVSDLIIAHLAVQLLNVLLDLLKLLHIVLVVVDRARDDEILCQWTHVTRLAGEERSFASKLRKADA